MLNILSLVLAATPTGYIWLICGDGPMLLVQWRGEVLAVMAALGRECGAVICWFGYIFFLLCNVAITARGIHLLAPLDHSVPA